MDKGYLQHLVDTITDKDNLKKVKEEALKLSRSYSPDEYIQIASELYCSEYFQIQEIGVLLYGYASSMRPTALKFLSETVSTHPSWKVQEVLAMAFDIYCSTNGYKNSLPTIKEWLQDSRPNVRRAVSEGLRIWTNRDYFRENPQIAISLLSDLKADNSEYVRKSAGNALRDISKKYDLQVLRFFMLSAHYRSPINFSAELMEAAKNGLERILTAVSNLKHMEENLSLESITPKEEENITKADEFTEKFKKAMEDDFNTADAISAIFELVKFANTTINENSSKEYAKKLKELIVTLSDVLGIIAEKEESIDDEIEKLIEERQTARKEKNFARADEIRALLLDKGIVLEDTREGVKWKRV